MDTSELANIIEVMLFAAGEPVEIGMLLSALISVCSDSGAQINEETIKSAADQYNERGGGLEIVTLEGKLQILSSARYADYVGELAEMGLRKPKPLSRAALEILAITAYNQPVTKGFIEQLRGVDSSYTLNLLSERGFIEECGRLEAPGRPILYATTDRFLRYFGISNLSQLPKAEETDETDEAGDNGI